MNRLKGFSLKDLEDLRDYLTGAQPASPAQPDAPKQPGVIEQLFTPEEIKAFKESPKALEAVQATLAEASKNPEKSGHDARQAVFNIINQYQSYDNLRATMMKFQWNPVSVGSGAFLMLIGLYLVFRGRATFKAFLALTGFVMGGCTGLYLCTLGENVGFIQEEWVYWVSSLALAVGGAVLLTKAFKGTIYLIAFFGGIYASMVLMGLYGQDLAPAIKYAIMGTASFACAAFAKKFEEALVISSTALMGSLVATFGFDVIYPFGFRTFVYHVADWNPKDVIGEILAQQASALRSSLIVVVFVTAFGIYVQYRFIPRTFDKE